LLCAHKKLRAQLQWCIIIAIKQKLNVDFAQNISADYTICLKRENNYLEVVRERETPRVIKKGVDRVGVSSILVTSYVNCRRCNL